MINDCRRCDDKTSSSTCWGSQRDISSHVLIIEIRSLVRSWWQSTERRRITDDDLINVKINDWPGTQYHAHSAADPALSVYVQICPKFKASQPWGFCFFLFCFCPRSNFLRVSRSRSTIFLSCLIKPKVTKLNCGVSEFLLPPQKQLQVFWMCSGKI